MTATKEFLNTAEAADKLGCTPANVRFLGNAGKFPGRKNVGTAARPFWLYPENQVEAYKLMEKHPGGRPKNRVK